jgi:hypothetical protein
MSFEAKRIGPLVAAIFVVALGVYGLSAALLGRVRSPESAYFDLLADAFLHGRLYLDNPPVTYDLTPYAGHWYVPFPPLPALLLLPWVAIGGVAGANTVVFSAAIGAANVVLAFLLLRAMAERGWSRLDQSGTLWLTALFGLGTVHWYMSTLGSVWFLAQICTVTFMLLGAWLAAVTQRPVLGGAALAIAMLSRPHVALVAPLLLAMVVQYAADRGERPSASRIATWTLWLLAPIACAVALLLLYNQARFGNPFDFGYTRQNVARELVADLQRYGQFNLHYVPHNLWAMLLAGPVWDAANNQILPTIDGMSLLLTTPALVYLVEARQRSALALGAWVALGLLVIPLVTYYNTGWWQFGYRFSLDFMTPALVLLAMAAGTRVGWRMRTLIVVGIVVNAWGLWWFMNPRFFR